MWFSRENFPESWNVVELHNTNRNLQHWCLTRLYEVETSWNNNEATREFRSEMAKLCDVITMVREDHMFSHIWEALRYPKKLDVDAFGYRGVQNLYWFEKHEFHVLNAHDFLVLNVSEDRNVTRFVLTVSEVYRLPIYLGSMRWDIHEQRWRTVYNSEGFYHRYIRILDDIREYNYLGNKKERGDSTIAELGIRLNNVKWLN